MYVCVCRAVTERQIEAAVKGGARHLRDLRSELGIIEDCGRCARCAKQCMDKAIEQLGPPPHSKSGAAVLLLHPAR
mgnify:CR=1 FL=1